MSLQATEWTVNDRIAAGMGGAMQAVNSWGGTDFHCTTDARMGETLRFTHEDGTLSVFLLTRNGVLRREARFPMALSNDSLVGIALAMWNG